MPIAITVWTFLLWAWRVILYMPTLARLVPAIMLAVHEVECAIRGCNDPVPPSEYAIWRRRQDFYHAIKEARRGRLDGIAAVYRLYTRRKT